MLIKTKVENLTGSLCKARTVGSLTVGVERETSHAEIQKLLPLHVHSTHSNNRRRKN